MRIEALKDYLIEQLDTLVEEYRFNIDYLDISNESFSLNKIPTQTLVETDILGHKTKNETYTLYSKKAYSSDILDNLANIGFFENFEELIQNNNEEGTLPDIEGILEISCTNCGALSYVTENEAVFSIQIRIKWEE